METKTLKYLGITALLGLALGIGTAWAGSNTPKDGMITVTPVGTVSFTLVEESYAFGNMDVNTSSNSATALRLTNTGNVSVTVDKKIKTDSAPAGWTAVESTGTVDQYTLYCATSEARIGLADFGAGTKFAATHGENNLTGYNGVSDPVIASPSGYVDLWFRLDMPTTVSNQAARTITVTFTGVAQPS
jgi:hypothetical protein